MSEHNETFAEHQAHAAKLYLSYLLNKHKGNIAHAAREADLRRTTFVAYVRKYKVVVPVRAGGRPRAAR